MVLRRAVGKTKGTQVGHIPQDAFPTPNPIPLTNAILVDNVDGYIHNLQTTNNHILKVSGTVTANPGFGNMNIIQPLASNLNATVVGTGLNGSVNVVGNGVGGAVPVTFSNDITTTDEQATSTITHTVSASTSNTNLFLADGYRLGAIIYNDSTFMLFVKLGTVASTNDFSVKLFPLSDYRIDDYNGNIDCVSSGNTGKIRLTALYE
jgi:hypothetical protein